MLKLFYFKQFSITLLSSIWPIDCTLLRATTPSPSGPGSDGNEGVLYIPQSSSITGTSPSDCSVSYLGHSLGGGLILLKRCSQCMLQHQLTGQRMFKLDNYKESHPLNTWFYLIFVRAYIFTHFIIHRKRKAERNRILLRYKQTGIYR